MSDLIIALCCLGFTLVGVEYLHSAGRHRVSAPIRAQRDIEAADQWPRVPTDPGLPQMRDRGRP